MNLTKKLFESRQTRLCSLVFKIVTRVLLVGSINSEETKVLSSI